MDKLLTKYLKIYKNKIAIVNDSNMISYENLNNTIDNIISNFNELKIDSKCTIALRLTNPTKLFIFYLTLLKMGICHIVINPKDPLSVQKKDLKILENSIIIQDNEINTILVNNTIFIDENLDFYRDKNRYVLDKNIKNNFLKDISYVFYGSGTTSEPKKIPISNELLKAQLKRDNSIIKFNEQERYFTLTNLYYHTPKRRLLNAIIKGLTIYLPDEKPKDIVSFCKKNKIQHLSLTTSQAFTIIENLKNSETPQNKLLLPDLKSLIVSSSIVSEQLRMDITKFLTKNLYVGYGCNEIGEITTATPEDIKKHKDTVGKVLEGINLSILKDNYEKQDLNRVGHIAVNFSEMIKSYFYNSEILDSSFKDSYFFPKDLGLLKEDGNLIYQSRSDDVIIFSGVNIYPKEIEEVLNLHPNVFESYVFSGNFTNTKEQFPIAAVVLKKEITEEELIKWSFKHLSWKIPKKFFFVSKLPKNKAGKVLKRELIKKLNTNN